MDGDGLSNADETAAGSDPRNANSINHAPTALLADLSIRENLPHNTLVGRLIPQDTDGTNGYFYELVEGNGASHNNLFTIDENGGVLTTKLFDYETDARSMSIRARATDPYGKSVENSFSIFSKS